MRRRPIDVVPEGPQAAKRRTYRQIPSPEQLGVRKGAGLCGDRRLGWKPNWVVPRARPGGRGASYKS